MIDKTHTVKISPPMANHIIVCVEKTLASLEGAISVAFELITTVLSLVSLCGFCGLSTGAPVPAECALYRVHIDTSNVGGLEMKFVLQIHAHEWAVMEIVHREYHC